MPVVSATWARRLVPRTPLRIVSWVLVLALVAGLVLLGWQWRHPRAFVEEVGFAMRDRDARVGVPLYIGVTLEEADLRGTITIRDAEAHVVRDTSDATVEFFVCTIDASRGIGAIGSVRGEHIHDSCQTLVPAEGASLELNADPAQQVLMAVTNARQGRVNIDGTDLTYSYGWQTGTQRLYGKVVLVTPTPPGTP